MLPCEVGRADGASIAGPADQPFVLPNRCRQMTSLAECTSRSFQLLRRVILLLLVVPLVR